MSGPNNIFALLQNAIYHVLRHSLMYLKRKTGTAGELCRVLQFFCKFVPIGWRENFPARYASAANGAGQGALIALCYR